LNEFAPPRQLKRWAASYMILRSEPVRLLIGLGFGAVIAAATVLVTYLARARVPPMLEPLAARWLNAGHDPKSFRALLWLCFWILAIIFFAAVGYGLYQGAMGLGRNFN
jgi:hypothetical protein